MLNSSQVTLQSYNNFVEIHVISQKEKEQLLLIIYRKMNDILLRGTLKA